MHSRRALLYVPGDDRRKIEKAVTFNVDSICLDLEDGVAANRKEAAREAIAAALSDLEFGQAEKLVRINAVGSGLEMEDIEALLPYHPAGIVIPKVETSDQIQWAAEIVEAAEFKHDWPVNEIRILIGVETAKGILNLKETATHPRLDAIIFGGEDFAASIGATRTSEAIELLYARQAVLVACAANGIQAIDIVTIDFKDHETLRCEALQGARMGFSGKQVIHPDQIDVVQEAFTPSAESITQAKQLIEAFDTHQKEGIGAFALDGRMIDKPLLRAAKVVLKKAEAAKNKE